MKTELFFFDVEFLTLVSEELKDVDMSIFDDDEMEDDINQVDDHLANVHLQTPERPHFKPKFL